MAMSMKESRLKKSRAWQGSSLRCGLCPEIVSQMNITDALMEPGAAMIEKNVAGDPTFSWESGKAQ